MSEKRFTGKMLVATNGEEFGFTIYDEDKRMSIDEVVDLLNEQQATIQSLKEENKELRKKLECCEYEHFKKELDKIHEKVEKGDLSDFCTLTISDKGLEHWNGVLE